MKAIILDCNDQVYKEIEISQILPFVRVQQPNPNVMVSWGGITAPATLLDGPFMGNVLEAKLIEVRPSRVIYKLEKEI